MPRWRMSPADLDEGFGWGDLSIADGKRQDAATAYLRPVMDRPNLLSSPTPSCTG